VNGLQWYEFLKEMITKVGGMGGFALLIGFIWRLQPITALTSTGIERLLLTKENRISIRVSKFLLQTLVATVVSFYILLMFFIFKVSFLVANIIAMLTFIITIVVILETQMKKGIISRLFRSEKKRLNATIGLSFIFSALVFSVFPAYLVWYSLLHEEKQNIESSQMVISLLLLGLILYIISFFVFLLTKDFIVQLAKKYRRYSGVKYYVIDTNSSVRWFIYHTFEKDRVLLGDKMDYEDALILKILEKKELLGREIFVEKILNNPDRVIE
jgi:glucan phosphoethanolaminetransferase (alkaline phosphatase superfamily)